MSKPVVVMVAGPNGAGKSSVAPGLLPKTLGIVEYVNADVIARGISGFNPDGAALAAGKVMLERLRELAQDRASFAFETTGASRSFAPWIKTLQAEGYRFLLFHVWVKSADISVARVAGRVKLGGHHVPEETIRRRYLRGLTNFFELYLPLADEWQIYDNSQPGSGIVVAEGRKDAVEIVHGVETWSQIKDLIQKSR